MFRAAKSFDTEKIQKSFYLAYILNTHTQQQQHNTLWNKAIAHPPTINTDTHTHTHTHTEQAP